MFGIQSYLFLLLTLINLLSSTYCEIPKILLCFDAKCSEPISEGRAGILYSSIHQYGLSFNKNSKVIVIGKSNVKDEFWAAQIGDKIGFVPSAFIKEIRVFHGMNELKHEVPLEVFLTEHKILTQDKTEGNEVETLNYQNVVKSQSSVQDTLIAETIKNENDNTLNPTVSEIVSSHKESDNVISGSSKTHVEKSSIPNLYSSAEEKIVQDQLSLNQKSTNKPKVFLNNLSLNQNVEKNYEEESPNKNSDDKTLVDVDQSLDSGYDNNTGSSNVVDNEDIKPPLSNAELIDEIRIAKPSGGSDTISDVSSMADTNPLISPETPVVIDRKQPINADSYVNNRHRTFQSQNGEDNLKVLKSNTGGVHSGGTDGNSIPVPGNNVIISENLVNENNVTVIPPINNISSGTPNLDNVNPLPAPELHMNNNKKQSDSSPQISQSGSYMLNETNASGNQFDDVPQKEIYQNNLKHDSPVHSPVQILNPQIMFPSMKVGEKGSASAVTGDSEQYAPPHNELFKSAEPGPAESLESISEDVLSNGNVAQLSDSNSNMEIQINKPSVNINEKDESENFQSDINAVRDITEAPINGVRKQLDVITEDRQNIASSLNSDESNAVKMLESEESLEITEKRIEDDLIERDMNNEFPSQQTSEFLDDSRTITENTPEKRDFDFSTTLPPPSSSSSSDVDERTFFHNVKETVLDWIGMGSDGQELKNVIKEDNHIDNAISPPSDIFNEEKITAPDEICKATEGSTINCNEAFSEENNSLWDLLLDNKSASPSSYNTFIYLVVTAVTVLLFTLGYYFIEKFRSDGPLIAKVNRLEQELLVSSKECLILKDELSNTKEKLNLFETSSNDEIITALQQEIEESKKIRAELENNVEVLQQELDAATEAGLDLNRMLSEVLTQKGGSETLMESVEHLQAQLNNQQKIIDEMTSKLITKTNENQELQDELISANDKIENLESEIEEMRSNLNVHLKDNENLIEELKSKNKELQSKINQMNEAKEKEVRNLKNNISEMEKKIKLTSDLLKIKEDECKNLKDSMKKIKAGDGKNMESVFESSRIKAELSQAKSENTVLKECLKKEEKKVATLDDKVVNLVEEIEKLRQVSSEAEKQEAAALTRLEVLSSYFKEKETQLQKELGLREAMWVQKQGDYSTIHEKIKSLEEEIANYKSQNETLKKEILDQERGLKAQITTLEKKAHENWIAARQAERKLEETKQEAAQLRNKMTLMEKNMNNEIESNQHHRVNDELNGGDALSPLMHDASSPILFPPPLPLDPNNSSLMPPGFIPPPMFMPPPPGGFMPHPPPFLPGDHRPPPLGRMSSPPLNNRFSPPPPPDYAYDRMSTPPLSPSSRNYRSPNESDRERFRHRTPTSPTFRSRNWEEGPSGFRPITSEREARREHKGGSNLSSGHSSDSLDKSSRHSSRV